VKYLINEELANGILGYLAQQPFLEVESFIVALRQLEKQDIAEPISEGPITE
jgi:hypothetical protein